MVIEHICLKCHKPIKKTKRSVKTVCRCYNKSNQTVGIMQKDSLDSFKLYYEELKGNSLSRIKKKHSK